MFRTAFFLLVCAVSLQATAAEIDSEALPPEMDMSEPPFWMSSYDEYKDFQPSQKEYYIANLIPALNKISGLESVSNESMEEASEWYRKWDGIRLKLYKACQKEELSEKCDEVAEVRVKALNLSGNKKEENRKADKESE